MLISNPLRTPITRCRWKINYRVFIATRSDKGKRTSGKIDKLAKQIRSELYWSPSDCGWKWTSHGGDYAYHVNGGNAQRAEWFIFNEIRFTEYIWPEGVGER